jgi:hypothetical protein
MQKLEVGHRPPSDQGHFFDYKPLFDQNEIDELWIITPNPVSATVQEHIDSYEGIEILHLSELEQDIIDFTLYATYLQGRFENDTLSKYYIPSRLDQSSITLHSVIRTWLTSVSAKPVAIWAGYGMGKTSYASFLASELAADFLRISSNRIPILIPLGDFYTAPRLDGLFANVLDVAPDTYPVALRVWQLPSCTVGAMGQGAEPSASAAPWPDCGEKFAA